MPAGYKPLYFASAVLPDGATGDDISHAADELTGYTFYRDVNATPWLLQRNKELADLIGRFIVTMGLGAIMGLGFLPLMSARTRVWVWS